MLRKEGLVQRKNASSNADSKTKDVDDTINRPESEDDVDSKETRLTLMEEVLLLGLKEKEVGIKTPLLLRVSWRSRAQKLGGVESLVPKATLLASFEAVVVHFQRFLRM